MTTPVNDFAMISYLFVTTERSTLCSLAETQRHERHNASLRYYTRAVLARSEPRFQFERFAAGIPHCYEFEPRFQFKQDLGNIHESLSNF